MKMYIRERERERRLYDMSCSCDIYVAIWFRAANIKYLCWADGTVSSNIYMYMRIHVTGKY